MATINKYHYRIKQKGDFWHWQIIRVCGREYKRAFVICESKDYVSYKAAMQGYFFYRKKLAIQLPLTIYHF